MHETCVLVVCRQYVGTHWIVMESEVFHDESWLKKFQSYWYRQRHGLDKGGAPSQTNLELPPSSVIPACVALGRLCFSPASVSFSGRSEDFHPHRLLCR